ncbi:SseB family protein [Xinfangfangia sp. CPCC 101601]|uniref:SseB family protein n=1 Tax=Pseudogemmobacter lacusdianii TaxID=3069608 RepID=A0ABU0VX44_9RHOB|nr:SseB family protein [Xinfangfangia sp. CPCC 101601]MDQ2065475.1 SseB family protein [Xinfangfangia sp. CPCC 101601]
MTVVTLLDAAHAAVSANPEDETARLRFYERLADGELFILLEREAEGDTLEPRIFEVESGRMVLVFDREERLAEFSGGVAPYAALPGRVLAGMLKGQDIGMGVNLDVAPSAMLLPPEALDWLAETLEGGPEEAEAMPERFMAPSVPENVLTGLDAKLARAEGLATAAVLCGVVYGAAEGAAARHGHVLAFLDAAEGAEPALARAVREALVFSGVELGELDVVFLASDEPAAAAMGKIGLRFDLTRPESHEVKPPRAAPGSDPAKPPKLR